MCAVARSIAASGIMSNTPMGMSVEDLQVASQVITEELQRRSVSATGAPATPVATTAAPATQANVGNLQPVTGTMIQHAGSDHLVPISKPPSQSPPVQPQTTQTPVAQTQVVQTQVAQNTEVKQPLPDATATIPKASDSTEIDPDELAGLVRAQGQLSKTTQTAIISRLAAYQTEVDGLKHEKEQLQKQFESVLMPFLTKLVEQGVINHDQQRAYVSAATNVGDGSRNLLSAFTPMLTNRMVSVSASSAAQPTYDQATHDLLQSLAHYAKCKRNAQRQSIGAADNVVAQIPVQNTVSASSTMPPPAHQPQLRAPLRIADLHKLALLSDTDQGIYNQPQYQSTTGSGFLVDNSSLIGQATPSGAGNPNAVVAPQTVTVAASANGRRPRSRIEAALEEARREFERANHHSLAGITEEVDIEMQRKRQRVCEMVVDRTRQSYL